MFDCTLINDELDILEIRLETLDPIIEKFIIIESDKTFSGNSKPLHFSKNRNRFRKFDHKIVHMIFNAKEVEKDNQAHSWFNEGGQRNKLTEVFQFIKPLDNICFISDVDEIPKPDKLLEAKELSLKNDCAVALEMHWCLYYLNYCYPSGIQFRGPYVFNPFRAKEIHERYGCSRHDPSYFRWHMCAPGCEHHFLTIKNAGWHFSWMGGIENIIKKLESYAHLDWNRDDIKNNEYLLRCLIKGKDIYGHNKETLEIKELSFLPEYVQKNLEKFQHLIL